MEIMSYRYNYNDYSTYLIKTFGFKVQKISIDAGFSCPNRDGIISYEGCAYCNNKSFVPGYCSGEQSSISTQIEDGISFFARKDNKVKGYLAYFQAYTNTYATLHVLKNKYEEALKHKDILGLIIGTRPDCINDEIISYLKEISKSYYVMVEFGVESVYDTTLLLINRGHSYSTAVDAITKTANAGICTLAHVILGLPNESKGQMLEMADRISELPLTTLKIHQLQIIKGTKFSLLYEKNPDYFNLSTLQEYINLLVGFIARLNPDIVIERFVSQCSQSLLIAPKWGIKQCQFNSRLESSLEQLNIHQGDLYPNKKVKNITCP